MTHENDIDTLSITSVPVHIAAQSYVRFGMAFASLGDAVQRQVDAVLSGDPRAAYVSPNALRVAAQKLRQWPMVADELTAFACELELKGVR